MRSSRISMIGLAAVCALAAMNTSNAMTTVDDGADEPTSGGGDSEATTTIETTQPVEVAGNSDTDSNDSDQGNGDSDGDDDSGNDGDGDSADED